MTIIGLFALTLTGHIIFLGYTGQVLLCQATLMAIGGYTTAFLTTRYSVPPILGIIAGMMLAIVFAYLVGSVVLRLVKWFLAIATLSIAVITEAVLVGWVRVTGGPSGIVSVPPFSLGGLVFKSIQSFYVLTWLVTLAGWIIALNLANSRIGRAFGAINRDEMVAHSLGIDVARYKVFSLMIVSAYAALSGALYVHLLGLASPNSFSISVSFQIMMASILGGIGTIYGVFLAAPLLKFLPEILAKSGDYKSIILGLIFIIVPMYFAGGIAGLLLTLWRRMLRFRKTRVNNVSNE